MNKTILLIENDEDYSTSIYDALQRKGFKVIRCYDGEEGIDIFFNNKVDLILLDIILPGIDGIAVLNEIRIKSNIPVIILTGINNSIYQRKCLALGVTDYVVKPCCAELLIYKLHNILEYDYKYNNSSDDFWNYGELEVNFLKKIILNDGDPILLSKKPFDILRYLVDNKGIALSRDQIINVIWGRSCEINYRTVDSHISKLRTTLNLDCLETISGCGYILKC